jgi:Secretion system C-terminal sorting domain
MHYNHGDNVGPCTSCAQNMNVPGGNSVLSNHPEIEVFPNPSSNEVSIYLHGMAGATELAIFDQLGKLVWRQKMEEGQQSVSLNLTAAHFMSGIYFVQATSEGQRLTQRLVIAK